MSTRQIRKILGGPSLPPPDSSDEDFEPSFTKSSVSGFAELAATNSEHGSTNEISSPPVSANKKKNKKKKKKPKQQATSQSRSKDEDDMDVDRAVREVNRMLGEVTVERQVERFTVMQDSVMSVHPKHLNVNYELARLFGPAVLGEKYKKRRTIHRYESYIVPISKYIHMFKRVGLSMSLCREENGYMYFTFDHDQCYQKVHRKFLALRHSSAPMNVDAIEDNLVKAQTQFHNEGILQVADSLFILEDYSNANILIEQSIAYYQYVAAPSFKLYDSRTRLEYKYTENRAFHIALLKYLYILSNKACHRTALELAKVLLNLDPSDPLAVIIVVDIMALRAYEHKWLIQAIDQWKLQRSASSLYNIQYSYALAKYHVEMKESGKLIDATKLLETAMINFPTVVMQILTHTKQKVPQIIQEHDFFNRQATSTSSNCLKKMTNMYAQLSGNKWKEDNVMFWFLSTACNLVRKVSSFAVVEKTCKETANKRMNIFQSYPVEVYRHLCVLIPLSGLVAENCVPTVECQVATDPKPPLDTINRYQYEEPSNNVRPVANMATI